MPFDKNWRGFVGWVHLSVLGYLRKFLPKLMPPDMISIAARGLCTPRQGMQKLKRDAVVFSSALRSESSSFVDLACSGIGGYVHSFDEVPCHAGG